MIPKQPRKPSPIDRDSFKIPFMPEDLDEPHEIKAKIQEEINEFQRTFLEELARMITAAFGLLAALAWRGVIQEFVQVYIKSFLGEVSGMLSELIFALIITLLAVVVTWRVAKLKDRLLKEEK